MSFSSTILQVIFPSRCISCGKNEVELCNVCLGESPGAERESANWIYPLFDYRHPPIKKALWLLKYKGKKRMAGIFTSVMYGRIIEELSELAVMENFKEPIIIPIPLSRTRYKERGYNQAELICKELMKLDKESNLRHQPDSVILAGGVNTPKNFNFLNNILIKIKETEHQARIKDRNIRLNNLSDSFAVENAEFIKNRNIILIDDITTTGATLNEARKVLRSYGARKIIAFTVAH